MAIGNITTTAAAGGDTSAIGRARLAESFDTFLSLLTTQLKNQDPLSPLDSNQFTQQIVQMTGVEQQLQTNTLLKTLISNTTTGISTAVSLIGKEVRAEADTAQLKDHKAAWTYKLDRAADDVKLDVLDAKGRVVASRAATGKDLAAGEHQFVWDGKSAGGTDLADGVYSLRITAKDSEGSTVASKVFAEGLVTGVEQADGKTLLTINGARIPWEKLINIRQPATIPTPGSSNATGDKTSSPAAA